MLQTLHGAYCVGSAALNHIIWQKCLYKQSSWSADSVIWFGIKQSVASHLLSYACVLERLDFYWYCPIMLTGIWKMWINLDICHWNCWPYPRGLSRLWHQSPTQKNKVYFSHIVADSESCWVWLSAVWLRSTCLTKFYNCPSSRIYEHIHWQFKPCLLMLPQERTSLACAWLHCRNSHGFCSVSNFCQKLWKCHTENMNRNKYKSLAMCQKQETVVTQVHQIQWTENLIHW